ncbi:MAG: GLUG motif-containing protein [Bacteroidales bacterium]|nr:GLUG motif-containing protein [Bacteroidales bacterium]
MKTRLKSLCLAGLTSLFFMTINAAIPVWDGMSSANWVSKPGVNDGSSADKSFLIESPEQLAKLAELVNKGESFAGKYFKLTTDLDLNNRNWAGIGGQKPFSGIFDGDGHIVKNLFVMKWSNNIGLFGKIVSATIKNIGVESGSIVCGGSNAGGIAGEATGTAAAPSTISNCYNKANLKCGSTDPRVYIGGIVGILLNNSNIDHCYNKGNITNDANISSTQIGGITGAAASNSSVTSCYSTGLVVGNNAKGGVVASNWAAVSNVYYDSELCVGANAATQAIGSASDAYNTKGMKSSDMKSSSFVALLNAGGNQWISGNGDYPLLRWENANLSSGKK